MVVLVSQKGLGRRPGVDVRTIKRRAEVMLYALGQDASELSVLLCDDATIRKLNRDYRNKNRATDVLAFPMPSTPGPVASQMLGDVVISVHIAAKQAGEAGNTLRHEITRLLAHGLLHLLGWDHQTEPSRQEMYNQTEYLVSIADRHRQSAER